MIANAILLERVSVSFWARVNAHVGFQAAPMSLMEVLDGAGRCEVVGRCMHVDGEAGCFS